ncbi:MAG: nuclear transport factor 2 family protein [Nitrososphaeraceae archaeon]
MAEKEIENVIRDLIASIERKDLGGVLSCFTDDATWFTPQGIFRGKEEIKRYLDWLSNLLSNIRFTYEGLGILVLGNKGVHQSIFGATYKGIKFSVDNICTYEFSGNKIRNHWIINDRLSCAQQASAGPITRKALNMIVAKIEKELHKHTNIKGDIIDNSFNDNSFNDNLKS